MTLGVGLATGPPPRAARTMASISSWLRNFSIPLPLSSSAGCPGRALRGLVPVAQLAEPGAQADDRHGVDLRNPRFPHSERRSHFLHGQFLEVVKRHHLAFLLRQFGDGPRQQVLRLRTQAQ